MCRPPFKTSTSAIPDHDSNGRRLSNGPQDPQLQPSSMAGLQDPIKQHNVPLADSKASSNKRKRPSDHELEQYPSSSKIKRQRPTAQSPTQVFEDFVPTAKLSYDTIMSKHAKNKRAGRLLDEAVPALRRRRTLQMSDGVLAVPATPDSTMVHSSKSTDRQKEASPKTIPQSKPTRVPLEDSPIVTAVLVQPLEGSSAASKLLTPTPTVSTVCNSTSTVSNPTSTVSDPTSTVSSPTSTVSKPPKKATIASPSSHTVSQAKSNKRFHSLCDVREVIERHLRDLHNDHSYMIATQLDRVLAYEKPRLDPLDSSLHLLHPTV